MFENSRLNTKFTVIGQQRKTPFCKQFWLLFKRGLLYSSRNPTSFAAIVGMGIFNAIILSAIFHDVGDKRILNPGYPPSRAIVAANQDAMQAYTGCVFFASID